MEKQMIEEWYEIYEQVKYTTGCYDDNAQQVADIIVNDLGYRKQEWISVEERLPQENEKVLAINSDGEIFIATYLVHKISPSARGYTTWASGLWNGTPTHWQPLPQPPNAR